MVTKEEILEAISNMSVLELVDLVKLLNQRFDLPQMSAVAAPTVTQPVAEETQTYFTVTMTDAGSNKIAAIKLVRQMLNLGLKDAKDQVDNVTSQPITLAEDISQDGVKEIQELVKDTDIKLTVK